MKRVFWILSCLALFIWGGCERSASSQDAPESQSAEAKKESQSVEAKRESQAVEPKKVVQFPAKIDPACRGGKAKVYDECSNQRAVLSEALAQAKASDKALLVVFGAEWCIWCHVFDKYVDGQFAKYDYEFEHRSGPVAWEMSEEVSATTKAEARALNHYVADNFVVAYIDAEYGPYGGEAIDSTGVDAMSINYFPYIMSVGHDGKVARVMDAYTEVPGLKVRESGGREYRGFQRKVLLAQLRELHDAAVVEE